MMIKHDYPYDIYTHDYFNSHKNEYSHKFGISYDKNFLKIQDEFAALCYATSVCNSYPEVENLLGLKENQSLLFPGEILANKQEVYFQLQNH